MSEITTIQKKQSKKMTPDTVKILDFTLFLGKYQTEQQRSQILTRLIHHIKLLHKAYGQDCLKAQEVQFLYQHITQCHSSHYRIGLKNTFPSVYKYIHNILFATAHSINLASCNIASIEAFAYLNAPNIRTLQLYGNHITSIKPFIKNDRLRNLATLTLYENPIKDIQLLQKSENHQLNYLEMEINKQNRIFCEDVSFIYKLPIKVLGKQVIIWYNRQHRIMRLINNYIAKFHDIDRYS